MAEERSLPRFQLAAQSGGPLSREEMDALIADNAAQVQEGVLGDRSADAKIRRSQTLFLKPDDQYRWLHERIWEAANAFNDGFFGVDITHVGAIQLARYDETDQGFYDWHLDFGALAPTRKISMSIQLSDPADYEGGDLELSFRGQSNRVDRTRGLAVAFPSFVLHRVTPVTRGVRWSLVAWITGPRWR